LKKVKLNKTGRLKSNFCLLSRENSCSTQLRHSGGPRLTPSSQIGFFLVLKVKGTYENIVVLYVVHKLYILTHNYTVQYLCEGTKHYIYENC
jgi:hypothetical protein